MNKAALALVLIAVATSAMAVTAQARATESNSLLQCGVNLGGKTLTYDDEPQSKASPDNRFNHVLGAVSEKSLEFTPLKATEAAVITAQNSDERLPPNFTLAIIGCSWR